MSAAGIGGGAMAAAGMGLSIAQAIMQKKAIERAAREAKKFEDFKFREFFTDALYKQRIISQTNAQTYATRGVDFQHGSPLAVEVDIANNTSRNVERMRQETEMKKRQIQLNADAGSASAIAQGVGGSLGAVASGLNTFNTLGGRFA